MRGRLVRDDVRNDPAARDFRVDLRAVADEPDAAGDPVLLQVLHKIEGLVEVPDQQVAVSALDPLHDPAVVHLDVDADRLVHLRGEGLRASHAPHPAGEHEAAAKTPAKMLASTLRERLVGTLHDPLGPDVRPSTRRHLPVHREAEPLELVELLPRGPVGYEVRVRD